MFTAFSESITERLEKNHTIKSEEREVYQYGIQQGLTMLLNISTTLVIGFLCSMLCQSFIFTIAYITLRSSAGGFHCNTPIRCYVWSILMINIALLVMRFIPFTNLICKIILLVSGSIIFFLAPVQDKNKPLDKLEHKVYRRRTLLIWAFEFALTVACMVIGWHSLAVCLSVTLAVMAIMVVLGQMKNVLNNST